MEPMNWASEHSDALRQQLAEGRSFAEAVKAVNLKFSTDYTRAMPLSDARDEWVLPDPHGPARRRTRGQRR